MKASLYVFLLAFFVSLLTVGPIVGQTPPSPWHVTTTGLIGGYGYICGNYNFTHYYARNWYTGNYELISTSAVQTVNYAFGKITPGKWVILRGNFSIGSTITLSVGNVLLDCRQAQLNLAANTILLAIKAPNITVLGGHWIGSNNPSSTADIGIEILSLYCTIDGAEMQGFGYNELGASDILPGWGSGYITIRNCRFHDSTQGINFEQNGAGHNTVQNCTFYNLPHSPIFVSDGTPYNEITDCEFYNFGSAAGHGIYFDGGGEGGNIVRGCNFHDSPNDAISDKTKNNKWYNNRFTNVLTGFSIHSQYDDAEANDNEIYNNTFTDVTYGINLGDHPETLFHPPPTSRNKIHDNTFIRVTYCFTINLDNNLTNNVDNTKIYYNTFNSCTHPFSPEFIGSIPTRIINTVIAYNNFVPPVPAEDAAIIESCTNTMATGNTGMADFNPVYDPSSPYYVPPP